MMPFDAAIMHGLNLGQLKLSKIKYDRSYLIMTIINFIDSFLLKEKKLKKIKMQVKYTRMFCGLIFRVYRFRAIDSN